MTFTEDGQKLRGQAKGVYILDAQGNIIGTEYPFAVTITPPLVSTVNSTTTPLNAGINFDGERELNASRDVMVIWLTDQDGQVIVHFSPDGINEDSSLTFTVVANVSGFHIIEKGYRWCRVEFKNTSGSNQTFLRLQTQYGVFRQGNAPLNLAITDDADAQTVKAVISGKELSGDYNNITIVGVTNNTGTYYNLPVVSGARPSELPGRVAKSITLDGLTVNTLVYTVTVNKSLYITDIILSVNNGANAVGSFNLRDGTTVAGAIVLPLLVNEGPSSGTALTETQLSFHEPIQFDTGVFYEEAGGTLTASGILQGYEE